jgi:hypothetical protein
MTRIDLADERCVSALALPANFLLKIETIRRPALCRRQLTFVD